MIPEPEAFLGLLAAGIQIDSVRLPLGHPARDKSTIRIALPAATRCPLRRTSDFL
jgi:hypothetical protein